MVSHGIRFILKLLSQPQTFRHMNLIKCKTIKWFPIASKVSYNSNCTAELLSQITLIPAIIRCLIYLNKCTNAFSFCIFNCKKCISNKQTKKLFLRISFLFYSVSILRVLFLHFFLWSIEKNNNICYFNILNNLFCWSDKHSFVLFQGVDAFGEKI